MKIVWSYLKQRINPVWLFLQAILLSVFVFDTSLFNKGFSLIELLETAMLFAVLLFCFRVLDDAGSVIEDRQKHTERTYLEPKNFSAFVKFTSILLIGLCLSLKIMLPNSFLPILFLLGSSIVSYFIFRKNIAILSIIPLLKYPFLIWIFQGLPTQLSSILIASSAFFMVASHDTVEQIGNKPWSYPVSIILTIVSGILVIQPWLDNLYWLLVLPVPLAIIFFRNNRSLRFIPLVYFPLVYIMLTKNLL